LYQSRTSIINLLKPTIMKTKSEVVEAIKGADLHGADLQGADLHDADLHDADLRGADLHDADLSYADLHGANLHGADLRYADLRGADLRYADLRGADLRYAYLHDANLHNADLRGADLRYADLHDADLQGANLHDANLQGANLQGAYLHRVDFNTSTAFLFPQCPSEGSFIAWKKASGKIIKIEVCDDAKRSSATTLKCRCSKAKVLEIQETDGSRSDSTEVQSDNDSSFIYKVGEIVEVEDFDENRFNECSSGIHFFIAREMAVKY
jgi:uncharacterized protein YjbI with pentapeptide repeats